MSENKHGFIEFSQASLKYTRWPGGERALLCFHGFGQDRQVFESLQEAVKDRFTVYSFDIFFHGESEWHRKQESFRPPDWFEFTERFFEKESIDRFEVLGFSMGAKFAMTTAELYPDRIDHIHLLAPDGIKTHFSYRFSTYPYLIRKLFKTQIKNPLLFKTLVGFSRALRLTDNYNLRFALSQMETENKRAQVYYSWVAFRHFTPNHKKLANLVNETPIQLTFYLGKYDKVINQKEITPLVKLLAEPEIITLESGHSKLIEAVIKVL